MLPNVIMKFDLGHPDLKYESIQKSFISLGLFLPFENIFIKISTQTNVYKLWDLRCPALAPLSQLLRSHCPKSEHSVNICHLSIWKTSELRNSRMWANLRGESVAKGRLSFLILKVYLRKNSLF
jgi:hypothetical protein